MRSTWGRGECVGDRRVTVGGHEQATTTGEAGIGESIGSYLLQRYVSREINGEQASAA